MRKFLSWNYSNAHPLKDSRYDLKLSIYFQNRNMAFTRTLTQGVTLADSRKLTGAYRRTALQTAPVGDYTGHTAAWLRRLPEQGAVRDRKEHSGGYVRGLYTAAGSMAGTGRRAEYYRKQRDVVNGQGVSLRHLFIFIRLLTTGFVRDYLLRRFLKAREEIVLKSAVTREVEIESK
jgi:hypothetical protein